MYSSHRVDVFKPSCRKLQNVKGHKHTRGNSNIDIMHISAFTIMGGLVGGVPRYFYGETRQPCDSVTYGNIFFVKYGHTIVWTIVGGLVGNAIGRLVTKNSD